MDPGKINPKRLYIGALQNRPPIEYIGTSSQSGSEQSADAEQSLLQCRDHASRRFYSLSGRPVTVPVHPAPPVRHRWRLAGAPFGFSLHSEGCGAWHRYVGNLAPMPGVFPDYPAPVIRNTDEGEGRELVMMRWGMPPPTLFVIGLSFAYE